MVVSLSSFGLFLPWTFEVFIILLCVGHCEAVVRVDCKPTYAEVIKKCGVGIATANSTIVLVEQDSGSHCVQNKNYFLVLRGSASYVWTMVGCFGVFDIYTPTSVIWSQWSPCSVTCGAGTRRRERACSTGRQEDCLTLASWSSVVEDCNSGPCDTESGIGPPQCGFIPGGYRIFGGRNAEDCQFPWMAMIRKPGTIHRCGGTIVNRTRILTAAHCLLEFDERMLRSIQDKPETLLVYTGSATMPRPPDYDPHQIPGLLEHKVVRVDVHEGYNGFNNENDIAVLTLSEPIQYDECNVPVCVVDSGMSVYEAKGCLSMGWGKTGDPKTVNGTNRLQWTNLDIISKDLCRYYYSIWYQPKVFCAGGNGHDACDGDSGGPLICKGPGNRYYQYGIVSSGFRDICGQFGGQYTQLQNYTDWLTRHLV